MTNYTYYAALIRRLPYGVARRLTRKRCHGYSTLVSNVAGKKGLEIGGPSEIFTGRHLIPVYDKCGTIDSCNFSSQTIWHTSSQNEKFGRHLGKQFVAEACDLSAIADEQYDFVAASHVLEHSANPLRAVQEWKRVLKPDGALLVIVPYKYGTFDRRRSFTAFEHVEADFRAKVSEGDLTHVDEILSRHDLSLDPGAGSPEQF